MTGHLGLFAFFAGDIEQGDSQCLRDAVRNGYELLPLDPAALALVTRERLPHSLMDEWVSDQARHEARRNADRLERQWFEDAREEFTVEGICWPAFDRHALSWFWREAAYARQLALAILSSGVRRLKLVNHDSSKPSIYYSPADTFHGVLVALVQHRGVDVDITPPRVTFVRRLRAHAALARRWFPRRRTRGSHRDLTLPPVDLRNRWVFAMNAAELHRFTPLIRAFAAKAAGRVAWATLDTELGPARQIAAELDIPVLLGPSYSASGDEARRFGDAVADVKAGNRLQSFSETLELDFHWKHFCVSRWPGLVTARRFWHRTWQENRPTAVIVSSLYDAESQLPAHAAKAVGIPTYSLPHGALQVLDDLISADTVLCGYELQRRLWMAADIAPSRLVRCRGIVASNEYPVVSGAPAVASSAMHVLALVDPVAPWGQRLLPGASLKAQVTALKAIATPPPDIATRLAMKVKTHPAYPEMELYRDCVPELYDHVLPAASSLDDALREADLVIGVNYVGSALLHVHRAAKPVVHLWCDPLIGDYGMANISSIMSEGGVVVHDSAELWSLISELLQPEALERLTAKSRSYAKRYLDDSEFPDLYSRLVSDRSINAALAHDLA